MTEKEFNIAKEALLAIIQDSNATPKIKLRATEDLLALIAHYEAQRWQV